MFLVTGCLSIYFGWRQFQSPGTIDNVGLAFGMLTFGLVSNFYAFSRSAKRLNQAEGAERWWQRLVDASTVETKATFLIDFLGTAAAGLGLVALTAYVLTGNVRFDGIGAILVGSSMAVGSVLLIKDVKGLIVGRSVTDDIADDIKKAAMSVKGVRAVLDLRTMYMGSAKLLVIIEVHLDDDLSTDHIEQLIDKIKHTILTKVPHAYHVQVEVETPDSELI
jgi:divalent metal cation (Fe/Co/Zn/Cd) transporter